MSLCQGTLISVYSAYMHICQTLVANYLSYLHVHLPFDNTELVIAWGQIEEMQTPIVLKMNLIMGIFILKIAFYIL